MCIEGPDTPTGSPVSSLYETFVPEAHEGVARLIVPHYGDQVTQGRDYPDAEYEAKAQRKTKDGEIRRTGGYPSGTMKAAPPLYLPFPSHPLLSGLRPFSFLLCGSWRANLNLFRRDITQQLYSCGRARPLGSPGPPAPALAFGANTLLNPEIPSNPDPRKMWRARGGSEESEHHRSCASPSKSPWRENLTKPCTDTRDALALAMEAEQLLMNRMKAVERAEANRAESRAALQRDVRRGSLSI
ncbi:unnamed protein product [Pleuronectes platessa]|uniref:Uncharacterized protein n=1 Tax=Pleuronectes platessa TaxID=8262 RepID=A0A9N7TQ63_PLEPL|nr:unnamed protein product [Pleuronectes platessa]